MEVELTLEQKFSLRSFEAQVKNMSHEQAQDFCIELYKQLIIQRELSKQIIGHKWGIFEGPNL